jgi:hypothetical protein
MVPPLPYDRVKETSTTSGTGTLTLAGAVADFQSFGVVGDGNQTFYCVEDGTNWEVGIGKYTLAGTLLSRDTVLGSSNAGALVNFGASVKNVILTRSAGEALYLWPLNFAPPPASSFSWVNQGSATLTTTGNALTLSAPSNVGSDSYRIRSKATPTAPYTLTVALSVTLGFNGQAGGGVGWRDSASGKLQALQYRNDSGHLALAVDNFTNPTTYAGSSPLALKTASHLRSSPLWLQLVDDNTNRTINLSTDGLVWYQALQVLRTNFLTPDSVFFFVDPNADQAAITIYSWREG